MYSLGTSTAAVPLYTGLGVVSGAVASTFSAPANASSRAFVGSGFPVPYRLVLGGAPLRPPGAGLPPGPLFWLRHPQSAPRRHRPRRVDATWCSTGAEAGIWALADVQAHAMVAKTAMVFKIRIYNNILYYLQNIGKQH